MTTTYWPFRDPKQGAAVAAGTLQSIAGTIEILDQWPPTSRRYRSVLAWLIDTDQGAPFGDYTQYEWRLTISADYRFLAERHIHNLALPGRRKRRG